MILPHSLFYHHHQVSIMQQDTNNNVTDVEFKEVPVEGQEAATAAPAEQLFNPVAYLTTALFNAGHPNPSAWALHIDPRAETAEEVKERIFFANRALRLYMSEQDVPDNISPRLTIADGIGVKQWTALVDQSYVKWLMGQFDEKGRLKQDLPKAPELKEFEGSLNLTDDEKAVLRTYYAGDCVDHLSLGDKTFFLIHRNGASCREWFFTAEPNVHYSLNSRELVTFQSETDEPSDLAAKINTLAPEARTVNHIQLDENDPNPQATIEAIAGGPIANPDGSAINTWEGGVNELQKSEPAPHVSDFLAQVDVSFKPDGSMDSLDSITE